MPDLIATPGNEPIVKIENDKIRILSRDLSTEMIAQAVFIGRLNSFHQSFYCGALLNGRVLDQPLASHEFAELVNVSDIPVNQVPNQRIIKMMKSEHAEAMIKRGSLRLGSIDYYRNFDNAEIGDQTEGLCVLSAFDGVKSVVAQVRGGLNDFLFCTFQGSVDNKVTQQMGYDAAIEITNVSEFSAATGKHLQCKSFCFSSCLYVRDRALTGNAFKEINPQDFMDGPISEILGEARAFLKSRIYAHQKEFRFSWKMQARTQEYIDIECPEIREFIRPA